MNALPLLTYLAINPLKRKRFQKFFQLKIHHGTRVDMQQAYEIILNLSRVSIISTEV